MDADIPPMRAVKGQAAAARTPACAIKQSARICAIRALMPQPIEITDVAANVRLDLVDPDHNDCLGALDSGMPDGD